MIVRIKNLRLQAIIGTKDWERETPQAIIINVKLDVNAAAAVSSDDLSQAVDYRELANEITGFVRRSHCFLLETLADGILRLILSTQGVRSATVEVDKPAALDIAESVSVRTSGPDGCEDTDS
jgi:FolB domain-containing protein